MSETTFVNGGKVLLQFVETKWNGSRWQLAHLLGWPESKLSKILNSIYTCSYQDFCAVVTAVKGEDPMIIADMLARVYMMDISMVCGDMPLFWSILLNKLNSNTGR